MVQAFRDFLWGLPLIFLILGGGLTFTLLSKGFQFRHLILIIKSVFSKDEDAGTTGIVSPLAAVSVAIGASVGVGNIGGVATAIATGGPGALFWMWMAALVGMIIKMVEVTLSVYYRKIDSEGNPYGGATYYIERGLGDDYGFKLWKPVALCMGIGLTLTLFLSLGNFNTSEAVASTFNLPLLVPAVAYAVVGTISIRGGLKSLGKISTYLVPFVCIFYVASGLIIIFINIAEIPNVLKLIVESAFNPKAAFGGATGVTFGMVIRTGLARSVYSNEAGWGTSPMLHASARTSHPIRQGMYGAFETFTDTIVVCSITGLVVLVTGQWNSGVTGAAMTLNAFETVIGQGGRVVLAICIFFFGVTTAAGWLGYIEVLIRHLLGDNSAIKEKIINVYRWLAALPGFLMVVYIVVWEKPGAAVWLLADIASGVPTFINMIVIAFLFPRFLMLLNDYRARKMGQGQVDPNFSVFYEDKMRKEGKIK